VCRLLESSWPMLLAAILTLVVSSDAVACSGPGAGRTIRTSVLIGATLGGVSLAEVVAGGLLLGRRSQGRRIRWLVAMMVLHPVVWMGATSGDCGIGLRYWSLVFTLLTSVVVPLVVCWPGRGGSASGGWRWPLVGAGVGALAGLMIAALVVQEPPGISFERAVLAGSVLASTTLMGVLAGSWRSRRETHPRLAYRISVRTLLLLPVVVAPLLVALLPVLPYVASVSTSSPFHFEIVDDETGQPIAGASVRLIDPRFAMDDQDNQGVVAVTGADGRAEYFLFANIQGREGMLGRTETISYHPWLIRVEAPGHRPFFTSLASETPARPEQWTAPSLELTFPPPPSVTIRLKRPQR
jgi:hypothetical protein